MFGRGTRARSRLVAVTLLCAAGVGATAAPAGAEIRSGSATDPTGDQRSGSPAAHDLVAAKVDYDTAGAATATITLAAPPSAAESALVRVYIGRKSGGDCQGDLQLLAVTNPDNPEGTAYAAPADGTVTYPNDRTTRDVSGTTVTMRATAPALAGFAADCVLLGTMMGSTVYDATGFDIAPPPPTPTVTQPVAPSPPPAPAPAPAPKPAPVVTQKVETPKGVQLALELPTLEPLRTNRWATAKIRVANTGTKAAQDVRLTVKLPRGVSVKRKTVKLQTIKAGKKRTATLRLRLTSRARVKSTLTATASTKTKGAKAVKGSLLVEKWRKGAKGKLKVPKPTPEKPVPQASLVGQAFTRVEVDVMSSNRWFVFTFVDDKWVYRGAPEESGFPACTAKTAGIDDKGDPTDGCLPYNYDPTNNSLTIDGEAYTVAPDRTSFTIGENTWTLAPIPPAGSVWNLALKGVSVWGYWPNQTVSQTWLTMAADGQFSTERATLGMVNGGAMNPGGANFSSVPPDQKGTYAVLPSGTLELRYADGKVERKSILILRDAKTGDADPARVGFLLGGVHYYLDDDD